MTKKTYKENEEVYEGGVVPEGITFEEEYDEDLHTMNILCSSTKGVRKVVLKLSVAGEDILDPSYELPSREDMRKMLISCLVSSEDARNRVLGISKIKKSVQIPDFRTSQ